MCELDATNVGQAEPAMLNSGDKECDPSRSAMMHPVYCVFLSRLKPSQLLPGLFLGGGVLMVSGVLASPSLAQEVPAPAASPPAVGFIVDGQSQLNVANITDIEYRGECPGRVAGTVPARFMSAATPPAPGRRVVVRNVSLGVRDNPFPFTDRNYSEGRSSEPTQMAYGTQHELRTFSVIPGVNNFEYEIKQSDRVVDKGTFQSTIQFQKEVERRWANCDREQYCTNGKPLDKCEDRNLKYRTKCTCPGGKTFYRY